MQFYQAYVLQTEPPVGGEFANTYSNFFLKNFLSAGNKKTV
jgi:hypothetical protein